MSYRSISVILIDTAPPPFSIYASAASYNSFETWLFVSSNRYVGRGDSPPYIPERGRWSCICSQSHIGSAHSMIRLSARLSKITGFILKNILVFTTHYYLLFYYLGEGGRFFERRVDKILDSLRKLVSYGWLLRDNS